MTSIAVIGPGAIGGALAAWLAQGSGFDITLCARTPLGDLRVETPSDGTITASPLVLTDPASAKPVDWVLVCTKTYDVDSIKPWLDHLVGSQTRVAIVQNGVEHVKLFAHLVAPERIVPVMINLPAARTAPGRIVQHREGVIAVPAGRDGEDFVALFAKTKIRAVADPDFVSQIWVKLAGNCAAIVPSLTLRATGPVWGEGLEAIVRGLVEECAAVGRAEGAQIPSSIVEEVLERFRTMPEGASGGSLHADRLAGNPMEIDARNGVIVRLGRQRGIPTPMNALLVTLLGASGSPWVTA
ncbi:MAG: 2-dehydropantoate 2-reductase [Devosia sp.]|uniref:2-dehydropantoate 2-reductase n=1 Tax=Devosia sp. TaxID=1871048 RepID=UPI0026116437|nr:2-dehydropantoate 2-reductase [Devosia sp.]MDB5529658.1 2-dehydropantoate 2-reductase [Devosia sp.]